MINKMVIYQIRNIIDNKCYIGQSVSFKDRKLEHLSSLRRNIHDNIHLQRAWNKYGEDNFKFEILYSCNSITELNECEINEINSRKINEQCYNISSGGKGHDRKYAYTKIWNGLISPEGEVYNNVTNLSEFADKHNLVKGCLYRLANGERYSHRGWKLVGRTNKGTRVCDRTMVLTT